MLIGASLGPMRGPWGASRARIAPPNFEPTQLISNPSGRAIVATIRAPQTEFAVSSSPSISEFGSWVAFTGIVMVLPGEALYAGNPLGGVDLLINLTQARSW